MALLAVGEGFVLYNGLALLFGIAESLVAALAGGGLLSLAWNGCASYCVAYTLYWLMVCYQDPKLMQYALVFLCLVSRPLDPFSMASNPMHLARTQRRSFPFARLPPADGVPVRCVRPPPVHCLQRLHGTRDTNLRPPSCPLRLQGVR